MEWLGASIVVIVVVLWYWVSWYWVRWLSAKCELISRPDIAVFHWFLSPLPNIVLMNLAMSVWALSPVWYRLGKRIRGE